MTTREKNHTQHSKSKTFEIEEQNLVVEEPPMAYTAQRYSYADYLTWTDDVMREIIDGVVYLFSAPVRRHAKVIITFLHRSINFIKRKKGKCEIYTAPFDVRFPTNGETNDDKIYNVVQPDICVICDSSKLDDRGCIGAPDLILEVNSPSTSKLDLEKKFTLYEASGVKEYWVAFPKEKEVIVFTLHLNGKYGNGTKYQIGKGITKVPVQTLKGLIIDLEELFED